MRFKEQEQLNNIIEIWGDDLDDSDKCYGELEFIDNEWVFVPEGPLQIYQCADLFDIARKLKELNTENA